VGCFIGSETGLAHTRAIVDNEGLNFVAHVDNGIASISSGCELMRFSRRSGDCASYLLTDLVIILEIVRNPE
jgi:hypothetical protein